MANKKNNSNLKLLRESKGLTLKELSENSGVHLSYISSLERGEKSNPSIDVVKKLSKALDITEQELLEIGFKQSPDFLSINGDKITLIECNTIKQDTPEDKEITEKARMRFAYSHKIANIINSSSFLTEKDLTFLLNQFDAAIKYIKASKNKEGD